MSSPPDDEDHAVVNYLMNLVTINTMEGRRSVCFTPDSVLRGLEEATKADGPDDSYRALLEMSVRRSDVDTTDVDEWALRHMGDRAHQVMTVPEKSRLAHELACAWFSYLRARVTGDEGRDLGVHERVCACLAKSCTRDTIDRMLPGVSRGLVLGEDFYAALLENDYETVVHFLPRVPPGHLRWTGAVARYVRASISERDDRLVEYAADFLGVPDSVYSPTRELSGWDPCGGGARMPVTEDVVNTHGSLRALSCIAVRGMQSCALTADAALAIDREAAGEIGDRRLHMHSGPEFDRRWPVLALRWFTRYRRVMFDERHEPMPPLDAELARDMLGRACRQCTPRALRALLRVEVDGAPLRPTEEQCDEALAYNTSEAYREVMRAFEREAN